MIALVVVPITSGVTAALIVGDVTDSGQYPLVIGSAVTVAMTTIVRRIRRGR